MFIRLKSIKNKKTGRTYSYYQLVESRKTDKGTRNVVILHIGTIDATPAEVKIISQLVNRKIKGKSQTVRFSEKIESQAEQIYLDYLRTISQKQSQPATGPSQSTPIAGIYDETIELGHHRSVGLELIGLHFWRELEFDDILVSSGFDRKQTELAKVAILGRLISPGSERHTISWFNRHTSLKEFSHALREGLRKDALYRVADKVLSSKRMIEGRMRANLKRVHSLKDTLFLYDLTNTYFEGSKLGSKLCKRGKSKEKRDDCPLVTLALVVDQDGFPVYSRIYRGNQSEPETLPEILRHLYEAGEDIIDRITMPHIAMDRGIATAANIAWLREQGYSYFVVERRDSVKDYAGMFSDLSDFDCYETSETDKIWIKQIQEDGASKLLVHSTGKEMKEASITTRRESLFLGEAKRLINSNARGYILDTGKIMIRIGRLKQKYGSTASMYDFILKQNEIMDNKVESIDLKRNDNQVTKHELPGAYVIESNVLDIAPKDMWDMYMKLAEVESAFRSLKSDLGTRPVYHKNDDRIEAHLFYSVIAYALLKSITYRLQSRGYNKSWAEIKSVLRNHMRSSLTYLDTGGYVHHIRQTSSPESEAKHLFGLLNIPVHKHQVHTKNRK